MLAKSLFALLALASVAVAHGATHDHDVTCNKGLPYCCKSFEDASSPAAKEVIAKLDTVPGTIITGQVGLDCASIPKVSSAQDVDVAKCSNELVCCSDNFENKLVAHCKKVVVGAE